MNIFYMILSERSLSIVHFEGSRGREAGTLGSMAEAHTAPASPGALPRATDWVLRPFDMTSLSPVWVGLAYSLAYLGIYLAYHNLTGLMRGFEVIDVAPVFRDASGFEPRPLWQTPGWWSVLTNAALVGFVPTMGTYLRQGARRDLIDLRPVLRVPASSFDALVAEVVSTPKRYLRIAGALGLLWGPMIPLLDRGVFGEIGTASLGEPLFYWIILQHMLFAWLITRLGVAEAHMTRAYARIGETSTDIDLLDLGPLAAFSRKGLRSALLWVILTSIFSLFWLSPGAGRGNALFVVLIVLLVTAAFLLPVRGVHHQIRATKRDELERVNRAIRDEREQVVPSRAPDRPIDARLSNLVAYRELVERVREWPFDTSTLLRFALYVTLGIGSWLGGAIVEKLLESAMG